MSKDAIINSKHPLYSVWRNMKSRCIWKDHPQFKYYGQRGITVCDEWKNDFKNFIKWGIENGYRKGLDIDRINNNLLVNSYSPNNCRFVTRSENCSNTRVHKNNKSGYAGIYYSKLCKKWRPFICAKRNNRALGSYNTKRMAVIVRNLYIIKNKLPHKIQKFID